MRRQEPAALSQEALRDHAALRIRRSRPGLAVPDTPTTTDLLSLQNEISLPPDDEPLLATVVLRGFDAAAWVAATCEFASVIEPATARRWQRSFTRTVFLAGNPENLLHRFSFDHVCADRSAAWLGPLAADGSATLRRLLKTFDGRCTVPPVPPTTVRIAGDGQGTGALPVHRDLYIPTAGVTLADCLIHLNHLLVESVIDGLVGPGDRLTLRQVPHLLHAPTPFAALRVAQDPNGADRLRAYAGLTEEPAAPAGAEEEQRR